MKIWWWMYAVTLSLLLVGCEANTGDDDDSSSADDDDAADDDDVADDDDTGPDDDDTGPPDDDDSASGAAFFTGFVFDPGTGDGIEAAEVTVIQEPDIVELTDDTGGYGVQVFELTEIDIRAASDGLVPSTVAVVAYVNTDPSNGVLHVMLPPSMLEELAQGLGTAHDPARGTLLVAAVNSAGDPIDGVQVTLDSDHGGSLLLGESDELPGDTLTADETMAIFVNVALQPTTVTLAPPAGLVCVGRNPVDPRQDEVVSVTYVCD